MQDPFREFCKIYVGVEAQSTLRRSMDHYAEMWFSSFHLSVLKITLEMHVQKSSCKVKVSLMKVFVSDVDDIWGPFQTLFHYPSSRDYFNADKGSMSIRTARHFFIRQLRLSAH